MKKSFKQIVFIVLIAVLFVFCASVPASACTTPMFTSYRMTNGLSNNKYYIDTWSVPSSYMTAIRNGASSWDNASNQIGLTETTNPLISRIDIFKRDTAASPAYQNAVAYVEYIANGSQIFITTSNWSYNRIIIHSYLFENIHYNGSDSFAKWSTMTHEFGHCFGVTECSHNNTGHVMYQFCDERSTYNPSSADLNTVLNLYQ